MEKMGLTRSQTLREFDHPFYAKMVPLLHWIKSITAVEVPIGEEGLDILVELVRPMICQVGVRLGACLRGKQGNRALFLDIETGANDSRSISVALTNKGYWIQQVGHCDPAEFRQTLSMIPAIFFLRAFHYGFRDDFLKRLNQLKLGEIDEGGRGIQELMDTKGQVLNYAGSFQLAIAYIIENTKLIPEN